MNLWQSLLAKWAADATLNNLLPAGKIVVGRAEDSLSPDHPGFDPVGDVPYGRWFTIDDSAVERTSKGILSQETVQISVWHSTHAKARAVQKAWRAVYDDRNLTLTLDDGNFISFIRRSGGRVVEDRDGTYHSFDVYELQKGA